MQKILGKQAELPAGEPRDLHDEPLAIQDLVVERVGDSTKDLATCDCNLVTRQVLAGCDSFMMRCHYQLL